MQQKRRNNRQHGEAATLDPLALTIALWLGLVVSAAAIGRMSADAMARANLDEARGVTTSMTTPTRPLASSFAPYGY